MKYNFKQIFALGTSALLIGMTAMAGVGAANYPAPFVVSGQANVAVVYGTGSGVAATDQAQATQIASGLMGLVSGDTTVSGGDSYQFEKISTKFHLGQNITQVISSSIDEDELPVLLADGKFVDDDNDEFDYTQKITIGPNVQLTMFEDNDYVEDQPTIGFRITSGITIMNYTLDFSDEPLVNDLATSELPFMGKTYYVLSNATSGAELVLTLLDSAEDTVLEEGSSAVVNGKSVTIDFISTSEVALIVDGESTNTLEETETQKLADGSYIGIKDIRYSSKEGTLSSVEFSIGSGKLVLTGGSEVKINDDIVSGLTAYLTNSTAAWATSTVKLSNIVIKWEADDDIFITEDTEITMPGFEAVKLSYGGLNYPVEETIEVQQGGDTYATLENFPLKDGTVDINFLYGTPSSFSALGKDANNKLVTSSTGSITYDKDTDDYFVVSWTDSYDAESYLMRATNFILDGEVNKTDFQYYKDGAWTDKKTGAKIADTFSIGNADLTVGFVDRAAKTVVVTNSTAETNFNTLYSATGLKVNLPWLNSTASNITNDTQYTVTQACAVMRTSLIGEVYTGTLTYNITGTNFSATTTCLPSTFVLKMDEEDKNGNIAHADGDHINVTIGWDGSSTAEVEVSAVDTENADATRNEIGDTDVWRDFTYSALATEILYNKPSSGQMSVKVIYHGDEVAADVYISEIAAVISGADIDTILVTDTEVSTVQSRNLVVVGGSCINSVAATLVGGSFCTTSWTTATDIGTGQFLIQSYANPYATGKVALLVAGYEREDTVNAATYLRNIGVDTTVGKTYIGTTATQATLQVS